ncbi:GNAT family N-acetyltransferase [Inhella proteolytica]|uniref:GNAT family N-acetyltransferase n=1 Tax=Inhella proteolytica TaxID=2795029 RepID=A0A931J1I4_9BURK|nr:GNAT family N-acetyltransferase [Inhella proteolytica]MBH9576626.1 GNAT family N-acetyltransferase [Inhella proteolytica]
MTAMAAVCIRALDPAAPAEIDRVAQGMQATLIEVEGEVRGRALHSLEWLRERVLWHLDHPCAAVWLAVQGTEVLGHSLVRAEPPGPEETLPVGAWGLVTTSYVWPPARRRGIARQLLLHDEAWMRARGLSHARTWTGANNHPLIALYERHGYAITQRAAHASGSPMLCLSRSLAAA